MVHQVVLLEDHTMMLDGLVAALADEPELEVIGTARSLADLRACIVDTNPSVVVADYRLPDGFGTEVTQILEDHEIAAPVILMSGTESARLLDECIAAGCAGYVSKTSPSRDLARAIVLVCEGRTVFPSATTEVEHRPNNFSLTSRELQVLQLLANASSASEIGAELDVSVHTVRNHIRSILAKLHANSQLEAVVVGVRSGLVTID